MGRNQGNITVAHIKLQKLNKRQINYRYKRPERYKYKNKYTNKYNQMAITSDRLQDNILQ